MKVQRVILPDSEKESWLVLGDDFLPVPPIQEYLRYLEMTGKSPHTVKNSAIHLKEYWTYLREIKTDWRNVNLTTLSEFVGWLRFPATGVVPLYEVEAARTDATINGYLGTVSVFYEFQKHSHGVTPDLILFTERMAPQKRYKRFLHHISKGKPARTRMIKLKVSKRIPRTLEGQEIEKILDACDRHRDRFLLGLLYQAGLRIGQVLGLRHSDVQSMDNIIHVVPRENNVNRARAKTTDRYSVHVSKELMKVYAKYVLEELGDIESDYVFVNLWQGQPGRPMTYSSVRKLFQKLQRKTGIKVTPHVFRHTHATEMIRSGMRSEFVQKRVGHKQLQTTVETYTHLNDQDMKRAYEDYLQKKHQE